MLIYHCPTTTRIVRTGIEACEADVCRLRSLKLSLWCPHFKLGIRSWARTHSSVRTSGAQRRAEAISREVYRPLIVGMQQVGNAAGDKQLISQLRRRLKLPALATRRERAVFLLGH
jgi:hypothetical protein